MTSSRLMHWILCCLVVAVGVAGCATDTTSSETSGSLSLNLEVGSVDIDEVDFLITGDGMDPVGGTIDTSAPGATASVEVFGLLPGDYTVTLSATATDGETMCEGSEHFSVEADELTEVMVYLRCKLPETLGGVRVNGEFNVCAVVNQSVVKPLQTSVGNDIDLSAMGEDAEGDDITYLWTGTGGDIDDPNAMNTTYTCEEVGKHSVTITVSDDGFDYCMDSWTTVVTCVAGEAECTVDAQCADDNDCTQDVCAEGRCLNPDEDEGASCDQDGGAVCDGEGTCVECNNNLDCDDGFVCNDNNECVRDVECIENAQCADDNDCTQDLCTEGSCSNPNEDEGTSCSQDGGAVCDGAGDCVECNTSADCDDGFVCDESNACVPDVGCTQNAECADNNDCTQDLCTEGSCSNPNEDGGTSCSQDGGAVCDGAGNCVECNVDGDCETGDVCLDNNVCVGDPDILCDEGLCVDDSVKKAECVEGFVLCIAENPDEEECAVAALLFCSECITNSECDDENQCTDNTCSAGACVSEDTNADATCDQNGGSVCDGSGNCVECNSADQCTADGNECTAASCVDGACGQTDVADGTSCDGGSGECQSGVCEPVGPPTFDLSASVFKPYNSLLPDDTGTGDPYTDCAVPDLSGNLGANLTGITGKCIIITPPDISGFMELNETSPGNFDVTIQQDLVFTIDVTIDAVAAQVVIVTNSSTALTGTGTGASPGTVTLDPLTAPFNMNAAATGITNCTATNLASGVDVSDAICPLAGLTGGDNPLPFPGDPGARTMPPINTTATSFQMGGGPADATGWYLSNPAPLAGNGTQWLAYAGNLQ